MIITLTHAQSWLLHRQNPLSWTSHRQDHLSHPTQECGLLRDVIPAGAETAKVVPTPNTAEQSLILLNNALLLVSVDGWIVDVGRVAHPSAQGAGVPQSSLCIYLQKVTGLTD